MNQYGLIGFPLSHSFSKKYFTEKFEKEEITDSQYDLFELENNANFQESFRQLIAKTPNLKGLNVTIPHKQNVMTLLDRLEEATERIGAVNVIKFEEDGTLIGYNSDYYGFKNSLLGFISNTNLSALILGTGGASKAVRVALEDLEIPFQYVSRQKNPALNTITYEEITSEIIENYQLIINTTPLGMSPKIDTFPQLPYECLTSAHYIFDLVYNPLETMLMQKAKAQGAKTKNGLEMLELQAEKAWEIWNTMALQ